MSEYRPPSECEVGMLDGQTAAFLDALPLAALVVGAGDRLIFINSAGRFLCEDPGRMIGHPVATMIAGWPEIDANSRQPVRGLDGTIHDCLIREFRWQAAFDIGRTFLIEPLEGQIPAGTEPSDADLRLRYVIEMLPQALCVFDAEDRYVLWNRKYAALYPDIAPYLRPGMPFEEILKLSLSGGGILEVVENERAWLDERMRRFREPSSRDEQQLRDGRWLRHDDQRTPDGGAIGMRVDITEFKAREDWLRQLFDANPMPMLLCDGDTLSILEANHAAVDFYGFDRESLLSKRAVDLQVDEDAATFAERLQALEGDCDARTIWRQRTRDGRICFVLVYVRLLADGAARRLLLTVADISDRVHAEGEANRLANHDALTGLPNRMYFYKALEAALEAPDRDEVLVFCLDLDGFKPVNDTFGHAAGDDVLKMVAERLRAAAEPHMVARLGGDEFAILMRKSGSGPAAGALAVRLIAAMGPPFGIRGLSIRLGVSIGLAQARADDRDGERLLQEADKALYRAKADGRNTWRTMALEPSPTRALSAVSPRRRGLER